MFYTSTSIQYIKNKEHTIWMSKATVKNQKEEDESDQMGINK